MSIINLFRHSSKLSMPSRLVICRYQSQTIVELLNKKAPIELTNDDELENSPIENTIEWNKKLKFYRLRGEAKKALKTFEIGIRKYQYQPDYITYVSMIELCKEEKDLDNGRYVHRIVENSSVKTNSRLQFLLLEMYIKCREVDSARIVFDQLKNRTVVEYNMMMTAYNNNQLAQHALDLFEALKKTETIKANNVTHMIYFQSCVQLKAFDQAKALHAELKEKYPNYFKNKELINQIITTYLAANDLSTAEELFKQVKEPTLPNYIGMMEQFNRANNWNRVVELYDQLKMQRKIQADVSTYLNVLTAVKHLKNVEKAKEIQGDLLKQNLWQNHSEIQKILKEIFAKSD